MKYLYSFSGNDLVLEFSVKSNTVINKGDPVKFDTNDQYKNVSCGTGDNFIGIAAEDHSGVEDDFNPRSNGTKIKVICPPDGVYAMNAAKYTVTDNIECTATEMNVIGPECDNVYSHQFMLVKKAEGSTNTDEIGDIRIVSSLIQNYEYYGTYDATVSSGGIACPGDEYAVIPFPGNDHISFVDAETFVPDPFYKHFIFLGSDNSCVDGNGKTPIGFLKLRNGPLTSINESTSNY